MPDTVWVVTFNDEFNSDLVGVFTTEEKALEAMFDDIHSCGDTSEDNYKILLTEIE